MSRLSKLTLATLVVCFVTVILSSNGFARPFKKINDKLDEIQATLEQEVIPKLEECCGEEGIVPQTGQTECYTPGGAVTPCDGTGQDGDLRKGIELPTPRFIDNGNGTVTDNLTKLVWLKDADRFGELSWTDALDACNNLEADGIELDDDSVPGDWRLPNIKELLSLFNYEYFCPCLSNADGTAQFTDGDPFVSLQAPPLDYKNYWSSTSIANGSSAFGVNFCTGEIDMLGRVHNHHVWPVRDAE